MRYLKYADWYSEIERSIKSIGKVSFLKKPPERLIVIEPLSRCLIKVVLNPNTTDYFRDEYDRTISKTNLKGYYQPFKPEFAELLDEVRKACSAIRQANEGIMEALTQDDLPQMVADRMAGRDVNTDPAFQIRQKAFSVMDRLVQPLGQLCRPDLELAKRITIHDNSGYTDDLWFTVKRDTAIIQWRGLNSSSAFTEWDVDHCLSFMAKEADLSKVVDYFIRATQNWLRTLYKRGE